MSVTELTPRIEARDGVAVTVYTKSECWGCGKTKQKLEENSIEYTEVDMEHDQTAYLYVTETLGYKQAPAVVVSAPEGVVHWSGLQPQMIRKHITHRDEAALEAAS
ncbi:glutaredoxin family protein [Paenarthrobacter ureafaciens]|uniref:glutaredoxin family protein n=1 Tax=Paenarthrobacter ureafaciens TaxID=37931 RepID=UPI001FB3C6B5|nr:glutaredoxin family protein [Paenarthrobacter ureafaciens]UOD80317.1 glutaredoxin family protein [Paenarthrobacter ureafaciens]WNZ04333.1 glutaredoxin family protein [Paenarthrobacter ureafaciens]